MTWPYRETYYQGDSLLIENIAWEGKLYEGKTTKTKKSRAPVYLPLELRREIEEWKTRAFEAWWSTDVLTPVVVN